MKTRVVEKVDLTSSKVRVSSRMSSLPSYSQRPLESLNLTSSVRVSSSRRLAVGRQLHERPVLALLELVLASVEIDQLSVGGQLHQRLRRNKRRFMVDLYTGIDRRTTRR